ncbi:MAG: sulfotransferase [Planctomycetota bacterium]
MESTTTGPASVSQAGPDDERRTAVQPAFLLSQPRSGSTLVQRMLAGHPEIRTEAEPWVLLPVLHARRRRGAVASYSHFIAANAITEYLDSLEDGEATWARAVRAYAETLYAASLDPGERVFLDKTPRYYAVLPELFSVFPDGKFVFLWRNPLATLCSIVEIWGGGAWGPDLQHDDLFAGPRALVEAYRQNKDRACGVRFEDVIDRPADELRRAAGYLGADDSDATIDQMLEGFASVKFSGNLGDPTGRKNYQSLSREPLEKWKRFVCNGLRKRWCRRYLNDLGEDLLGTMGYDIAELHRELDGVSTTSRFFMKDLIAQPRNTLKLRFKSAVLDGRIQRVLRRTRGRPAKGGS